MKKLWILLLLFAGCDDRSFYGSITANRIIQLKAVDSAITQRILAGDTLTVSRLKEQKYILEQEIKNR